MHEGTELFILCFRDKYPKTLFVMLKNQQLTKYLCEWF